MSTEAYRYMPDKQLEKVYQKLFRKTQRAVRAALPSTASTYREEMRRIVDELDRRRAEREKLIQEGHGVIY